MFYPNNIARFLITYLSSEIRITSQNLPCPGVGFPAITRQTNQKAALSGRAACRPNAGNVSKKLYLGAALFVAKTLANKHFMDLHPTSIVRQAAELHSVDYQLFLVL